jgi:hypothetical protein
VKRISSVILAALVAGGLAACSGGTPVASPTTPAASVPATSSSGPTTGPTTGPTYPPAPPHLGPAGYGALQLSMTRAAASGTGLTTSTMASGTGACGGADDGYLTGAPAPDPSGIVLDGRLFFSASTGKLVAIYAFTGVSTPEGIGLGSSYAQVHAAYPTWHSISEEDPTNGRGGVPVPGNPQAHFRIVILGGHVVQLSLDANNQDCYE